MTAVTEFADLAKLGDAGRRGLVGESPVEILPVETGHLSAPRRTGDAHARRHERPRTLSVVVLSET